MRDILKPTTEIDCIAKIVARVAPDVILLSDFDYDYDLVALNAFADLTSQKGRSFGHRFAIAPNSGVQTGVDLNGNGKTGDPQDAQGFGYFAGEGGMALMSRWPLDRQSVVDFSQLLWKDIPQTHLLRDDPGSDILRLSGYVHWMVSVMAPVPFSLLAFHAGAPVFDGPEDRNGRRNHDQIALWQHLLNGRLDVSLPELPFLIVGNANLDPDKGEGRRQAIRDLLADPRIRDPAPTGKLGQATVDWADPTPGDLRVSYVLPSATWDVVASAVYEPDVSCAGAELPAHRLVWADVRLTQ